LWHSRSEYRDTIRSNQRIAQIASQKAKELSAPVYTQLDIRVKPGIEVKYTNEEPGNPPPTLRIARGAAQWAKQQGFKKLWIVAAKPHLWRALRDIEKAVRETGVKIKVHTCHEVEQYPKDSWFCPNSTQKRVRSSEAWYKRERILKLLPFFIYKRIAK
jgi:hypothetical protein